MSDGRLGRLRGAVRPSRHDEPDTFERFYVDELRSVVELAYALAGNRMVAEEIAQEAFIHAWSNWDRISTYEHAGAWVRRVAANLAVSTVRRRLVEGRALLRLNNRPGTTLDPLSETHAEFWRAVRRLPRRQAQAIALYYLEDLSVKQIAAVLDCAEGTVKAHLHKARQGLARRLGIVEGREP